MKGVDWKAGPWSRVYRGEDVDKHPLYTLCRNGRPWAGPFREDDPLWDRYLKLSRNIR